MNPNTAEYYNIYWGGDASATYLRDKQLDEIAGVIVKRFGGSAQVIMDIGGGISRIARLARDAGHVPVVVDHSRVAVERMEAEGIAGMVYDVNRWRGRRLMPIVHITTCTEVLEHLDDPERAVSMARAHAKRGFYTTPNNCMGPDEQPNHLRMFTAASLRELLERHYRTVDVRVMHRWLVAECTA